MKEVIARLPLFPMIAWLTTIIVVYLLSGWIAYSPFMRPRRAAALAPFTEEHKTWKDYARLAVKTLIGFTVVLGLMVGVTLLHINLLKYLLPFAFWISIVGLFGAILNPTGNPWQLLWAIVGGTITSAAAIHWPNWILINALSVIAALSGMISWRFVRMKSLLALSIGFFLYDFIHVFGTGLMEMLAARVESTPMTLSIPATLATEAPPLFTIGLGDLVVPGFLVMLSFRVALHHRSIVLPVATILGVLAGNILTLIACLMMNRGQPAMIYILPCGWLAYGLVTWTNKYHDPDLPEDEVLQFKQEDSEEEDDAEPEPATTESRPD